MKDVLSRKKLAAGSTKGSGKDTDAGIASAGGLSAQVQIALARGLAAYRF